MIILLVFAWVYAAMLAMAFWESYAEKRNAWDKGKLGWKLRIGRYVFTAYHFYIFFIMWPLLMTLPLVVAGWSLKLLGILISAYFSGTIVQDFMWYVINPAVKVREFWTEFSDYYPWLRIKGHKILPWGYILAILISVASWFFLWR